MPCILLILTHLKGLHQNLRFDTTPFCSVQFLRTDVKDRDKDRAGCKVSEPGGTVFPEAICPPATGRHAFGHTSFAQILPPAEHIGRIASPSVMQCTGESGNAAASLFRMMRKAPAAPPSFRTNCEIRKHCRTISLFVYRIPEMPLRNMVTSPYLQDCPDSYRRLRRNDTCAPRTAPNYTGWFLSSFRWKHPPHAFAPLHARISECPENDARYNPG